MANIMINKLCNLNCSYCFANEFVNSEEYVNSKTKGNMTIENFKKALEFVKRTDTHVGIIGGEPTIHPKFGEILEIIIKDPVIKTATVFTNALNIEKYYDLLSNKKFNITVNFNSANDIGDLKFKRILKNIDEMITEKYFVNNKLHIGVNFYKEDFDYDYVVDVLEKYNLEAVRLSVVIPNNDESRNLDSVSYFMKMKPVIMNFFKELKRINVMPHFDCNVMPRCIFTEAELKWFEEFWKMENDDVGRCNLGDCSSCSAVIDILEDLSAVRCFGLSREHKVKIDSFENLRRLERYFMNKYDTYAYVIPSSDVCNECKLRLTNECMGGCLAFKINKINKAIKLVDKIGE